jgi:hypothetical protein
VLATALQGALNVRRQAPPDGLEEAQIVARTIKDVMHQDHLLFNSVEDQVVFNDEVSVSKTSQLVLLRNPTELRMIR